MEIYQATSKQGENYIIFRYFDNHNNNYEYKTYKLVQSRSVAREFGVSEYKEGRPSELNTREMCDILIEKIKNNEV